MLTDGTKTQSHRAWQNELGRSFSPDKPEQVGLTKYVPPLRPELTPEQLLARQKSQVRQDAEAAYDEPVTDANGVTWAGGFDSGLRANMGAELGDYTGKPQITLYDADDNEHLLSPGQAKQVAATIGAAYQQKLAAEKAALRALKAIDLEADDAREQIKAVTFAAYYP